MLFAVDLEPFVIWDRRGTVTRFRYSLSRRTNFLRLFQ